MMITHIFEPPLALKGLATAEAVEAELERYILEPAHCRRLAEPTFWAALLPALRESGESNFTRIKSISSAMKLSKIMVYFPLGFWKTRPVAHPG